MAESASPASSFPPPPARDVAPTPDEPSVLPEPETEPPPDDDADFFEKRDETANEAAEKPIDASLPKQFESDDEDDWYVRTGQPAPEREGYEDGLPPISVDRAALEEAEESPVVVWLPAIAMVSFVLIGVAVVLLVSLFL